MQEALEAGDAILRDDTRYLLPKGARVVYEGPRSKAPGGICYLAHPHARTPRFLVPEKDSGAQSFILTLMSADRGILGALMRLILSFPFGRGVLSRLVFRECVVIAP